jgi:AraC-like DNA-binding protein
MLYLHQGSGSVQLSRCPGPMRLESGWLVVLPSWMPHRVELKPESDFRVWSFDHRLVDPKLLGSINKQRLQPELLYRPDLNRWLQNSSDQPEPLLECLLEDDEQHLPELVSKAVDLAYESAALGFGAGDVAHKLDFRLSYLTDLVRQKTGRSLGRWIVEGRLERAKMLLSSFSYPVERVAEMCGYADTAHFRRALKAYCGLQPSQIRSKREGTTCGKL